MTADDHLEILNLLGEYAHRADSGDAEGYADLYASDGELIEQGISIPRNKIALVSQRFNEMNDSMPQPVGGKHITVNPVVKVNGDSATAYSDLLAFMIDPERGWRLMAIGNYDDILVRTAAGWRFQRRLVTWYKGAGPDATDPGFGEGLEQMINAILAEA